MIKEEDDNWLRDAFSELPEPKLSPNFESRLMLKITQVEAERIQQQSLNERKLERILGVASVAFFAVVTIFVFAFFGLYKPFVVSLKNMSIDMNLIIVGPVLSVSLLLIGDLLARKYLSRKE